jgi:subtilase family serine protease
MLKRSGVACLLSFVTILGSLGYAATQNRITSGLTAATVPLAASVHHLAQPQFDRGPVDPAMPMGTITLLTPPSATQQQALKLLLAQQQDRKSASYHQWLTPEQYADRFGLSQADIAQIVAWLEGQGFTNVHPARGRNWVSFTGNAGQVQSAFATEIRKFEVNGKMHYANSTAPRVPAGLAGIAVGFRGLHDFLPHPMNKQRPRPFWYSTKYAEDFVAPGDIGTIYDINALYTSGIDGTGQKIAVMGQTDVYLADINDFRTGFGLSSISCTTGATGLITACNDPHFVYKLYGSDPGASTQGDISEADLDLEWSGAVARGAQIIYVNSTNTFNSFYDAIDNNLAPVISLSYGECEFYDNFINTATGSGQALSNEAELQKANAEGITFVNSSGDSGAAECDFHATVTGANLATQGLAVSYPASSPEVTGVGGTGVALSAWNSSTYWGTGNGTNGGTALSYVPEVAWNDSLEISQFCLAQGSSNKFCTQGGNTAQPGWVAITSESTAQTDIGLSAGGGGTSNCSTENAGMTQCVSGFARPSWQTVTVAGTTTRLSPDLSFLASPNFPGYVFCTPLSELGVNSTTSSCAGGITSAVDTNLSIIGGTSASAPVFAGIVALLNQYTASSGQGNLNPSLYQLAATAPSAFHDVTSGDIKIYCVPGDPAGQLSSLLCPSTGVIGYTASAGFDMATGLGSMDVNNFAVALKNPPDFSASTPTTTLSVFDGQTGTATITVTPIHNFTGAVRFACSGLPTGASCSFSPTTVTPPGTTQTVATITAGSTSTAGTVVITASTGTLSTVSHQAASIALTTAAPFTLTADAASFQVAQGSNVNATIMVTPDPSFTGTISFSCNGATVAPSSTCVPPPSINAAQGNQDVSFQITTALPTAKLHRPLDRGSRILYATLFPGLFGLVFIAGSRKRSTSALRVLGLIAVLGVSSLWMSSCGGSSSGGGGGTGTTGTPKNTYTITVTGTSGATTSTATFQLVVQ